MAAGIVNGVRAWTEAGGCCVSTSCVAAAGVPVIGLVVESASPLPETESVSPAAAFVSDRPEKVATPLVATTVRVPPRVVPPGLLARASVTVPLEEGSGLPAPSVAWTVTRKLCALALGGEGGGGRGGRGKTFA